jgi:molybdopterin synthase catalytic subunit
MILSHNGVVRESSRDGRPVSGIEICVDREKLGRIIADSKRKQGIVEVLVELAEENKFLPVGADVMMLVVAGDIREHVFETLKDTLNAIKATVTAKTEYFIEGKKP